jgi:hypothetical protein
VKDVALHPIDLVTEGANPTAAGDATHVDNTTPPGLVTKVAATKSQGSSLLAARADHAHGGVSSIIAGAGIAVDAAKGDVTISTAPGLGNKLTLSHVGELSQSGVTEQLIYEENVNFDDIPTGNIEARLTALTMAATGAETFNLRVGGTIGAIDGTIRATVGGAVGAWAQVTNKGAAFANPTGQQLVKITALNADAGGTGRIRGISIAIG